MQHIAHGLWISDIDAVRKRSTERFDHVVSVCQDACHDNVGCSYNHIRLTDDAQSAERWGGSQYYPAFQHAVQTVLDCLENDNVDDVLVHCHAGENRSAAVCAAALARYDGERFEDALRVVEDARPIVNPSERMRDHGKRFAGG